MPDLENPARLFKMSIDRTILIADERAVRDDLPAQMIFNGVIYSVSCGGLRKSTELQMAGISGNPAAEVRIVIADFTKGLPENDSEVTILLQPPFDPAAGVRLKVADKYDSADGVARTLNLVSIMQ